MKVAMRVSRRSCAASAKDSSLDRSVPVNSAVAIETSQSTRRIPSHMYPKSASLDFSHEDFGRAATYHRAALSRVRRGSRASGRRADGTRVGAGRRRALAARRRPRLGGQRGRVGGRRRGRRRPRPPAARVLARPRPRAGVGLLARRASRGWLADHAKGFAVGVAADGRRVDGRGRARAGAPRLVAGRRRRSRSRSRVLAVSFVAPVVLEPLFNRFAPLADEQLAGELRALGEQAGVPVRDVLVADASRRTTKVNAYVSGLARHAARRPLRHAARGGRRTGGEADRRARARAPARPRTSSKGTLLAMAGAAVAVLVLWATLGTRVASPRELPLALLLLAGARARRSRAGGGALAPLGARRPTAARSS